MSGGDGVYSGRLEGCDINHWHLPSVLSFGSPIHFGVPAAASPPLRNMPLQGSSAYQSESGPR